MGSENGNLEGSKSKEAMFKRSNVIMNAENGYDVTFVTPAGEKTIKCLSNENLIYAAEEAGIDLPYSCMAGACTTCVGRIISGEVDDSDQTVLSDKQRAKGLVMTCVAYPKSNLKIETHLEQEYF